MATAFRIGATGVPRWCRRGVIQWHAASRMFDLVRRMNQIDWRCVSFRRQRSSSRARSPSRDSRDSRDRGRDHSRVCFDASSNIGCEVTMASTWCKVSHRAVCYVRRTRHQSGVAVAIGREVEAAAAIARRGEISPTPSMALWINCGWSNDLPFRSRRSRSRDREEGKERKGIGNLIERMTAKYASAALKLVDEVAAAKDQR